LAPLFFNLSAEFPAFWNRETPTSENLRLLVRLSSRRCAVLLSVHTRCLSRVLFDRTNHRRRRSRKWPTVFGSLALRSSDAGSSEVASVEDRPNKLRSSSTSEYLALCQTPVESSRGRNSESKVPPEVPMRQWVLRFAARYAFSRFSRFLRSRPMIASAMRMLGTQLAKGTTR
jgi:hypothetical protein